MTFKEFINERDYQPDYSDGRTVRPPAPAQPAYSDEEHIEYMDDQDAKKWADALVMVYQNNSENKSIQQVENLWQSIQTEVEFDRIEELIFMHLQTHERKNAAAAVLSIIRPGGAAVLK